jgi:hypothetical protein
MIERAKVTEIAEPLMKFDLQLFAEEAGGSEATVGGGAGSSPSTGTSSIIPGDDYASGGPEAPDNEPAERVDFEGFFGDELEEEELAESDVVPAGEESPEEPDEVPEPVKKEQSPEANAAFAEMRRKTEELDKALKARDSWVEQNFGHQGIKTWDQYQAAIEEGKRQAELARQQELQQRPQIVYQQTLQQLTEQGYDQEVAHRLASTEANNVAHALEVRAMKDKLAMLEQQEQEKSQREQEIRQQQEQEAMKEKMIQDLLSDHKKLQEEYGNLVPADLNKLDQPTIERLQRGYSLYDAWFLSNRAKITEQTQKAAAQKTLNNLNSKAHLKTEGDGAGDSNASAIPLPADTLQMYMDSGMTEKQARAFHKKLYG